MKRRDPSLSSRALTAAALEDRKAARAKASDRGDLHFVAQQNARFYRGLARKAALFGA